jgi:hypothetical protein
VTSRRAQRRRALERATVARTAAGAPSRALERWRPAGGRAVGWSDASVGEKVAVAGKTAVAGALLAAPVVGAVKGGEYLASHSAMGEIGQREAERRKRKERGQP